MADMISAGDADDAALVALEQKYMRNERCTNDQVANASTVSTAMKERTKQASKIITAIKPWFAV
eukprot:7155046-Pyramimonas_sp.AAC.1